MSVAIATTSFSRASAATAPVGQGFTVTPSDLAFILKQIKIAERHAATLTPANPCGTLVGPGTDQIPDRLTAYGLRTVDGSCNNLFPGRETFAAADVPFPRLTTPNFRPAESNPPLFGPPNPSSYAQKKGSVFDTQPRTISNLIVDQTSTNPAAIAAAAFPVRTQGNPGLFACTTDPVPLDGSGTPGIPAGCVPSHQTLFIPNVTTDVGLSPPYNALFTFFGQFFDHGVDQTVKSGGTVFVPLRADDPLILLGPDGIAGNGDEVTDPSLQFMVLTRGQQQPGPDGILFNVAPSTTGVPCNPLPAVGPNNPAGCDETADNIQNAPNTDSPWVDQSQTYTSHSSHQVFLREYVNNTAGLPVATGKLLSGPRSPGTDGGIGTWARVKAQAAALLGLRLLDTDVTNIPMIATDPYGKFIPGPNGLPQYVTTTGLVEGNIASPVPVPPNARHFDTPFLTDIAHNADPGTVGPCTTPGVPAGCLSPDTDAVASADFAGQPAGTYDDEMLDAHFACGDGRCNENIALSTIHQVFHSEHDRLVDDIKNTLTNDTSTSGVTALAQWKLALGDPTGTWNGERLFQAARFVTEMEYQHLVFEEFARKIQPAVRLFHVYQPDINPAIQAEFAHAVYRFGHSMLNDTVARTNVVDGLDNSTTLLHAFLNPPELFNGHGTCNIIPATTSCNGTPLLTAEQGAGSIVMGASDQVGNELDEFVVETLRNNLLGLPLDLPTINMTRARSEGIPRLNDVRRQIFTQTNDGQLTPYTDWSDFGQHLKHPESLINFVAAYGTHPSISAAPNTLVSRRAAAKLIVDPADPLDLAIPTDAADFMFGSGAWANVGGKTVTGVDDVDLWVGGLAEVTNLFGGLLGSTFNYVFQTQLESLQDGDRFYYLLRTPGMNLRTQLEGNSFSELIQRNTDGTNTLKADAFATADCKFQLGGITFPYNGSTTLSMTAVPPLTPLSGAGSVNDTPSSDCDENQLLLHKTDGTIQYRQFNKIDPSGINGQSVYNGTPGVDRIFGGNDNDTFWGGLGNDIIEGNGGDDIALGGAGNDIITDLSGADVPKGGPGNDALDGGIGDDIPMGGDGQDFINGGANDNETFAGPGNDFVIAGQGADAAFGDGGDDWIQGGSGQDLLIGDHSAPFFDDPAQVAPGNDIFIGQVGENDYDAEGGDDIMSQNAAVDRNAGAAGFDWAIHQYDTVGADDDLNINNNLVGVPIQVIVNRDRWQETEADSGSAFDDIIKGTDVAPAAIGGAGFTGCDALDPAGVARIQGLNALVTTFPSPLAPIVATSAAGFCPLNGGSGTGNVWGEGDILIGGLGSDTITGRGANDIIDGDRSLQVRISVRTDPANPATELGSADLMEHQYLRDSAGNLTGNTLQADVFNGTVDPGNLVAVREIVTPTPGLGTDTAVYRSASINYTITSNADGSTTVTDNGPAGKLNDGSDTLWNVELLQFSDQTVRLGLPGAPTIGTAVAGVASATVNWTSPGTTIPAITSFTISVLTGTTVVQTITLVPADATSRTVTGLTNGTAYTFTVAAVNAIGTGAPSATSNAVTPLAVLPPAVTQQNPANGATGFAVGGNINASFSQNVQGVSTGTASTNVVLTNTLTGVRFPANVTYLQFLGIRILTINPTGDLLATTSYTVTITGGSCVPASGIRSLALPCVALATTSWSFTTAAANPAPTVIARVPAINATNVDRTANISATFSEDVQGVSSTTATLTRRGVAIATTVTYNAATRTVTIDPVLNLRRNSQFTVTLRGGAAAIRDLTNLPLTTVTWSFTTGP